MNTYSKFIPNVFLAKCEQEYEKGETIILTTKYAKQNESIVFNLIFEKNGFFYYSIVRADGYNVQKHAAKKADRLHQAASNASIKSQEHYVASNKNKDFLALGEPIKIGHHSEKGHRKLFEQANRNMSRSIHFSKQSQSYEERAAYWDKLTKTINLSMPESIEYFEFLLEKAKRKHQGLKDGTIEKTHSFSMPYAKREVNELTKKVTIAKQLWS